MMMDSSRIEFAKLRFTQVPIALGLFVGTFATVLHSIQFYMQIELQAAMPEASPFFPRLHAFFVLAFLLSLLGLLLRSRTGLVFSTLSLILGLLVYAYWYRFSYRDLKLIRESEYPIPPNATPPHLLGLVDANWLDIVILFAVVILLAWQIRFLIGAFRHRDRSN